MKCDCDELCEVQQSPGDRPHAKSWCDNDAVVRISRPFTRHLCEKHFLELREEVVRLDQVPADRQ